MFRLLIEKAAAPFEDGRLVTNNTLLQRFSSTVTLPAMSETAALIRVPVSVVLACVAV